MRATYTIKEAWENACKEEGIPTNSTFVVFSESNRWAKCYNKAIKLYFKSQQMMRQLNS